MVKGHDLGGPRWEEGTLATLLTKAHSLQTRQSEPAIQQAAWRHKTAVSKGLFPVVLVIPSVSVLF